MGWYFGASLFERIGDGTMEKIKKVTVHAGHNKHGKIACGASDYIDESKETRIICRKVIRIFRKNKIAAVNCTVNNGKSQNDVLVKIKNKIEKVLGVCLNISLHMNACKHSKADGRTKGVEVCVCPVAGDDADYTKTKKTMKYRVAQLVCKEIAKLGFTNRGVKFRTDLYILNRTSKPAILIEICFVDDQDDAKLYKQNKDAVAQAIVKAVLNYNKSCS